MTAFVVVIVLMVLLSGLSVLTGAEFEAQVKAARRWLGRKLMPPHTGEHTSRLREVAASAQDGPGPRLETAGPGGDALAVAGAGASPEPSGVTGADAVLGDDMIADVRARWNAGPRVTLSAQMTTAELALLDAKVDSALARRPVNGRSLGTLPRKQVPDRPPWKTDHFPVVREEPYVPEMTP